MAEEVKETREDFEAQLEESLNKASTNEDAVWNRLEQMKEDGDVLALTVGGVVNGGVIVYVEGIRGFIPASLLSTKYVEDLNVWLQKDVEAKIITIIKSRRDLVYRVAPLPVRPSWMDPTMAMAPMHTTREAVTNP